MKPRISVLTLGVADFEKAVKFYKDGLGLPSHNTHFTGSKIEE